MKIDWDSAPAAPRIRAGADRRVVTGERTTAVRVATPAGTAFDGVAHRHEHEQWVLVLTGRLRFRVGDAESDLEAGDVVLVPPWQWHAAVGVGPEGADYLELSAPVRLDLLPGAHVRNPLEFAPAPGTSATILEESNAR